MSEVLNGKIVKTTEEMKEAIRAYDLLEFGAGIDSGKHFFVKKIKIINSN